MIGSRVSSGGYLPQGLARPWYGHGLPAHASQVEPLRQTGLRGRHRAQSPGKALRHFIHLCLVTALTAVVGERLPGLRKVTLKEVRAEGRPERKSSCALARAALSFSPQPKGLTGESRQHDYTCFAREVPHGGQYCTVIAPCLYTEAHKTRMTHAAKPQSTYLLNPPIRKSIGKPFSSCTRIRSFLFHLPTPSGRLRRHGRHRPASPAAAVPDRAADSMGLTIHFRLPEFRACWERVAEMK